MVSYATNELIPSSEFAKKFGSYLSLVKENKVDKLAVLKNNKIEAVLLSKDEYELMCEKINQLQNNENNYSIDQKILKKVVRTTQAIEGYSEASLEVKSKVQDLKQRYGIKVSA